jgi:hypothetical protein
MKTLTDILRDVGAPDSAIALAEADPAAVVLCHHADFTVEGLLGDGVRCGRLWSGTITRAQRDEIKRLLP